MVLETLALFSGVKELFMYNRQSYSFNKTIDQERLYHLQKMRIEQVKLYRDDIRDLFALVVGKMNNYYLVNTLALGFSLGFYYEGRVPNDIPSWLFWLWAMSLATAIVFLFLSVWFAVHASVLAQMFSTRLLTQWLRLPVPAPAQIDAAAPKLEEFETAPVNQQFRLPVVGKKGVVVGTTAGGTSDPPTTHDALIQEGYNYYLGHFYMFARLQKHWMSLDAYCRVCMVIGCNQILNVVTYTGLAYFTLLDYQWGAMSFVLIPIVFACIHVQINLLLSNTEALFFLLIHSLAPLLASVAAAVQMVMTNDGRNQEGADKAQAIAIASFVCHLLSSAFLLYLGTDRHNGLPTRFTTVNYIDVLGMQPPQSETNTPPEVKPVAEGSGSLKHLLSGRLSAIFSSGLSASEKEQPPIAQVVPPAASIRRADPRYQNLVKEKRKSFIAESARPSMTLPRVGTFSTPTDYEPTAAHLQTPDVLARMPVVAYGTVGITIVLLWIAGIVFSSITLSGVTDIGWVNVISGSGGNNTVSGAELGRRLSTSSIYVAPVAKFFEVAQITCEASGTVRVEDGNSQREYSIKESGEVYSCNETACGKGITTAMRVVVVKAGDREFSVNGVRIRIPLQEADAFAKVSFHVDSRHILAFGKGVRDRLLSWDAVSGLYKGQISVPCAHTGISDSVVGICSSKGGRLIAVFNRGDSCRF